MAERRVKKLGDALASHHNYTVTIGFEGTPWKSYDFRCNIYVRPGDKVVCDTSRGFQIGKVESVHKTPSVRATKWIVCRLDEREHLERVAGLTAIDVKRARIASYMESLPTGGCTRCPYNPRVQEIDRMKAELATIMDVVYGEPADDAQEG